VSAAKARIQKQITAQQTLQSKILSLDTTTFDTTASELDSISGLETQIAADLAALA